MPTVTTIDPVTRLEGHLKIEVTVDSVGGEQQVVDAHATGTLFRGFESILVNRDPRDAQHVTQRICGVCPVSHSLAACLALENAFGTAVPNNTRVLRNLVLGANYLQSHILHFYHLAIQDFIQVPDMPPWTPSWNVDKRLGEPNQLIEHYVRALDMRRKAHEMGALFGGRMPLPPTFVPGGFTTTVRADRITRFRAYLTEIINFIKITYIPDVELIATVYRDYYTIGRGHGNLLAYGVFDLNSSGSSKLLWRGQITNGSRTTQPVNLGSISENITHSWYSDTVASRHPSSGVTTPQWPKTDAYSWLKAPRYSGLPYEVGPLARMWMDGGYLRGISVIDRHRARTYEALKVAKAMDGWLNELVVNGSVYTNWAGPITATGSGQTEAPRGALGHWLAISNTKLSKYQVVTPTCWNASPRDDSGVRGPIEEALIGTPVRDIAQPIEVLRVIHSFDPCLSCAVHVMRPAEDAHIFALGHYHGDDEIHSHAGEHGHDHVHEH